MKKSSFLSHFFNLMYPNLCVVCDESLIGKEEHLCLACLNNIPRTNYHFIANNPVEKRFWGKVPIHRATAFFFFQKGSPYQKTLHQLKYSGNKEMGEFLGKYAAQSLMESEDFSSIDMIVPVPLHPNKFRKRGYNQSEWIAKGLSEVLKVPLNTTDLIRVQENPTQTKKGVYERYKNTEGIFQLNDILAFEGKHILLVDDVLTTGSTIEACINAMHEVGNVRVSVFVLTVA
mgnify:CR=1 FL=1